MHMAIRLLVAAALIAMPAFGRWDRVVDSLKGESPPDSPPPHSLRYFQADPCLRPASDRVTLSFECTWPGKAPATPAERVRWARTTLKMDEIGKAGAFTVYELTYTRNGANYPDPDARSILVKTGPDQYREIDVRPRTGPYFPSSNLITVQGQPLLDVPSHDGGQNQLIRHRLSMLLRTGAELVDFAPVEAAVRAAMPANMSIRTFSDDFAGGIHEVIAYRNDLNVPAVSVRERARITIKYRFQGSRIVIADSKCEPFREP